MTDPGKPGAGTDSSAAPRLHPATDPDQDDAAALAAARTWHWVVASLASAILAVGVLALLLQFVPTVMHEARHSHRLGMLMLESLPLMPPVIGGVIGSRTARGQARATVWCFATLGALVGLAVVAVVLYGLVALVAYLFVQDWQF